MAGATVGDGYHNCARREIDAGGNGRSGEDGIEQSRAHHFFNHQLPRRQMSGMMRSNTAADDRIPMPVAANLGMLFDEAEHEVAPRLLAFVFRGPPMERVFGRSFVASPPRRQENDRGQQIV